MSLPQRRFRSNRLGTLLSESQQRCRGEKRARSPESQSTDRANKMLLKPILDASDAASSVSVMSISDKHECDRGIYTIHNQKSASNSTPPIKLKRPTVTATHADEDMHKRSKIESTET